MPGPDEIRRHQEAHRPNLAEQLIREIVPAMKAYDPVGLRQRLAYEMRAREPAKRECPICGLDLKTAMFCPRCSNLIP
jgi:hypothetical protein